MLGTLTVMLLAAILLQRYENVRWVCHMAAISCTYVRCTADERPRSRIEFLRHRAPEVLHRDILDGQVRLATLVST
jgi:hypothetical protein